MRRLFWRLAYLPCLGMHKAFGLSYKWVNVGYGAWHRDRFDALWQHQFYGERIGKMPDQVNLCGILYNVKVKSGIVEFRPDCTAYNGYRIYFVKRSDCWHVEISVPMTACHIQQASAWVRAVFGDDNTKMAYKTVDPPTFDHGVKIIGVDFERVN